MTKLPIVDRNIKPANMSLRAAIRNLRVRHGLAYRHVAVVVGCKWTEVGDLETGTWEHPPITFVLSVLKASGGELRVYVPDQSGVMGRAIDKLGGA